MTHNYEGRQRFRLLKAWFDQGIMKGEVVIIDDREPTRFPSAAFHWMEPARPDRVVTRRPQQLQRHGVCNSHLLRAEMAAWPLWVYRLYDSRYLAQMAKDAFSEFLEGESPAVEMREIERTGKERDEKETEREKEKEREEDGDMDVVESDDDEEGDIVGMHSSVDDPVGFSFWLAGNLPCGDDVRQKLLEINSSADRLRKEIKILKVNRFPLL